jgi:ABC-type multidrug transport system permease subunit
MEGKSEVKRMPTFFTAVILIMLIMSLVAFLLAVETYITRGNLEIMNIILSVSAIALSIYILLQVRRKPLISSLEALKVLTVIQCIRCGYKSVRNFSKGDYVLKEVGSCPKCSGTLLIHSIFREVEKKEKFD